MTDHPVPVFEPCEFGGYLSLKCRCCGNAFLHQSMTEVFERAEDADHGLHVTVQGDTVTTETSMEGNPSARRQGLRIFFDCETCEALPILAVVQHKGNTFVYWEA